MTISVVSIGLAAYQIAALGSSLPRVSELSRRWPWAVLIWSWWLWLGLHFGLEAWRGR